MDEADQLEPLPGIQDERGGEYIANIRRAVALLVLTGWTSPWASRCSPSGKMLKREGGLTRREGRHSHSSMLNR